MADTPGIIAKLRKLKAAAPALAALSDARRRAVLKDLAAALEASAVKILKANARDVAAMDAQDPRRDRLLLNQKRLAAIAADVRRVAALPSPLGKVLGKTKRPNGLAIERVAVPLGVVGVVYEARPNVTVDVFALCFKTGNACALKGGKEAKHSNAALFAVIQAVLAKHRIPKDTVLLLPPDRAATAVLLAAQGLVDVCIPRGSQQLIDFVRSSSRVPVIETGAGIVHTYFDKSGDLAKGRKIVDNAKTRRVSVCNALDTLLVHKSRIKDLPALLSPLKNSNVELYADAPSLRALKGRYPAKLLHAAKPADYGREFLDYKMSVKAVGSLAAALAHIAQYTSHHSEAIIAEDRRTAESFLQAVDAAAVYANAPTAFTDGGEFGLGAEIGISTQKLHARGPMGLEALTSYKWVVRGNGQIRPA
jgi:glutamate-5-semialdehyde dehydrogenase